jgi:CBS-domain-containing membrane protein
VGLVHDRCDAPDQDAAPAPALIAVIGGDSVYRLGYLYVLVPAGLGALVLLVVALLINNIPRKWRKAMGSSRTGAMLLSITLAKEFKRIASTSL